MLVAGPFHRTTAALHPLTSCLSLKAFPLPLRDPSAATIRCVSFLSALLVAALFFVGVAQPPLDVGNIIGCTAPPPTHPPMHRPVVVD